MIRLFFILILLSTSKSWGGGSFEFYKKNMDEYFIVNIDVDKDGEDDYVVSSSTYKGNEPLFFKKVGEEYNLILNSFNLTVDGGDEVFGIYDDRSSNRQSVMVIVTTRRSQEYRHYINYIAKEKRWIIDYTEYSSVYHGAFDTVKTKCTFNYDKLYLDELSEDYSDSSPLVTSVNLKLDDRYCDEAIDAGT